MDLNCAAAQKLHPVFMHQHCDGQLKSNTVHRYRADASSFSASTFQPLVQCPGRDHTLGWKLMQSDQLPHPGSNQVGVQKSNEIVDYFVDGFPTDTGALPRL